MFASVGAGGETEAGLAVAAAIVVLAMTVIAVVAVPIVSIWERRFWERVDSSVVNALLAASRWEYWLGIAKGCAGHGAA